MLGQSPGQRGRCWVRVQVGRIVSAASENVFSEAIRSQNLNTFSSTLSWVSTVCYTCLRIYCMLYVMYVLALNVCIYCMLYVLALKNSS